MVPDDNDFRVLVQLTTRDDPGDDGLPGVECGEPVREPVGRAPVDCVSCDGDVALVPEDPDISGGGLPGVDDGDARVDDLGPFVREA